MKSLQATKKALVMGASSGIGAQVARILLERGWTVGVAARRQEPLQALRQEFPHAVHTRHIDVTEQDAPQELTALVEEMGGIDLYFHASGVGKQNPDLDPGTEIHTAATNADGFMRMVICAYRYMAAHGGGHIAVISSIAGTKGLGPAPAYSATKALQTTYIEALEQLARTRRVPVTFTDIRPGFVATPLIDTGHRYPMMMDARKVAQRAVKATLAHRHVAVIDSRYALLTALWRLLPRWLWRRFKLC